jgi:hypothetical protein
MLISLRDSDGEELQEYLFAFVKREIIRFVNERAKEGDFFPNGETILMELDGLSNGLKTVRRRKALFRVFEEMGGNLEKIADEYA